MNKKEGYKDFWKYFYAWCHQCGLDPKEKKQGVYILRQDEEIVYVGKTDWLNKRLFQHSSRKNSNKHSDWNNYRLISIQNEEIRTVVEKLLIHEYQPPLNKIKYKVDHLLEADLLNIETPKKSGSKNKEIQSTKLN